MSAAESGPHRHRVQRRELAIRQLPGAQGTGLDGGKLHAGESLAFLEEPATQRTDQTTARPRPPHQQVPPGRIKSQVNTVTYY